MNYPNYPVTKQCPYCSGAVILTTNDFIYDRLYGKNGNYNCYVCITCKASVGTHPDGKTPLGLFANQELKDLKQQCHNIFDAIWKNGSMKRSDAYNWLAQQMGISKQECHFGWFNKEMLYKALEVLKKSPTPEKRIRATLEV